MADQNIKLLEAVLSKDLDKAKKAVAAGATVNYQVCSFLFDINL
jgi:hypothetical protein